MSDFWDDLTLGLHKEASSLDEALGALPRSSTGVRNLTDKMREAMALPLPVDSGTRVTFANNLGAVLSYSDPPDGGAEGTVVMVRTSSGDATALDGLVFVKWDDGKFLPVGREHLRLAATSKRASSYTMRVSSIGDLTDFMKVSKDDLVHKATKDLWRVREEDGEFVIERLFDEVGEPLKV